MNKFITMLILGVVAAAMLLVLGMHVRQQPDDPQGTVNALAENSSPSPADQAGGENPPEAGDISSSLRTPVRPPAGAAAGDSQAAAGQTAVGQTAVGQPGSPASSDDRGDKGDRGDRGDRAGAGQPAVIPVQSGSAASADSSARPGSVPTTPSGQAGQPGQSNSASSANSTGRTARTGQPAASAGPARQAPATASVSRGRGNIIDLSLHFRGRGMALVIEGSGPLPARHFVLAGPDRLVVDLPGSWRNLKAPAVPANNLVKSVRLGRHEDADRLVLDLKGKLKSHSINRISDNKVEVLFN